MQTFPPSLIILMISRSHPYILVNSLSLVNLSYIANIHKFCLSINIQGMKDGSVDKMLDVQVEGLEFVL